MTGTNAVLPPRTGWGFEPSTLGSNNNNNQGNQLNDENSINNASSIHYNPFASSPSDSRRNLKRRNDRDSDVDEDDDATIPQTPALSHHHHHQTSSPSSSSLMPNKDYESPLNRKHIARPVSNKRARVHVGFGSSESPSTTPTSKSLSRQNLPVRRVIESLDRKGLEDLIEKMCQNHGQELVEEISTLAPKVTVSLALENLKSHYNQVCSAFPYRGNQQGDYSYYRVKPHLDDFFSALVDYTLNFLPPNESLPSNSLSYLDGATQLLCSLPDWDNPLHNHSKNSMLDEFSSAWLVALKEASKSSNGLGLMFQHGWERKLELHNVASNNRLSDALGYLRQELTWTNDVAAATASTTATPSPHTIRVANYHNTFF